MRQQLLEYYERELAYVRQLGAEFAKKYPAIAGRLLLEPDRCADPHVERLLESFAFLTARIHLRLDDDLPELVQGMLDVVYPHYLRPIPSMTIAEFTLDSSRSNSSGSVIIPSGSELTSKKTKDGMPCKFRTGYPVSLWPIDVKECSWIRPEQVPAAPRVSESVAVLRLVLKGHKDILFSKLNLDQLHFYLSGDAGITLPIYELLSHKLLQVLLRDPLEKKAPAIPLQKSQLRAMGFSPEEGILPYTPRSFQGYRLLQEYFSFQEKFLFFELNGLEEMLTLANAGEELELLFYFSAFEQLERMQTLEVGVTRETLRLNCTPIINLFTQVAEPVLLTQKRHEYPIHASARNRLHTEIFSIDSVSATNPSRRTSLQLPPLFERRFETTTSTSSIFWRSSRKYNPIDKRRPSDLYLSIVDANGEMTEPNAEVLTVHCTCTNHDLPSQLPFGANDGDFYLENAAGVEKIRALHRPTPSFAAPATAVKPWSLVSQLSLNHLSLEEDGLPALREILRLHNFSGAANLDHQIDGILSLETKRHIALMQSEFGSAAVRGMRVEMLMDESHFAGGGAYLFSAVLEHFFGLYVSMNSFSQLVVRSKGRKEVLGEWSPRAGSQVLL